MRDRKKLKKEDGRKWETKNRKIHYSTIGLYGDDDDNNSCMKKESEKELIQDTFMSLHGDVLTVRIKNDDPSVIEELLSFVLVINLD